MKIIEEIVTREIDVSRSVVLWNLLDFEHLRVVHKGYTNVELVFENDRVTLEYVTFRVPVFSFLRSRSLPLYRQGSPELRHRLEYRTLQSSIDYSHCRRGDKPRSLSDHDDLSFSPERVDEGIDTLHALAHPSLE